MTQLGSRNFQVLSTVIDEYIAAAAPVSSKAVAERSCLKLSPASIRNSMAELTELGLLEQPHTSAGRIPTIQAFRLYIDSMLSFHPLDRQTSDEIFEQLDQENLEIGEIFRRATSLVSERCNQVSMLLTPERKNSRWNGIGFTRSGRRKILAVLALESGMIETRLLSVNIDFTNSELLRFSNYLNAHFQGLPLWSVRQAIADDLAGAGRDLEKIIIQALMLGAQTVDRVNKERELLVDGTQTIFDQAEFSNFESAREMFAFLEERSRLLKLLDAALASSSVQVSFCDETSGLPGCSVVSAPYGGLHPTRGVVSIIGPNRMDYSAVMPVVGCISRVLTHILQARA